VELNSWTVDAQKVKEFRDNYYSRCDMALVQINWGGKGGFYYIPFSLRFGVAGGVLLLISATLCFAGGATTLYKDLLVWGASFMLAGIFGIIGGAKKEKEEKKA